MIVAPTELICLLVLKNNGSSFVLSGRYGLFVVSRIPAMGNHELSSFLLTIQAVRANIFL